ncbi:DUF2975 domain-containing protein [Rathayibacter tanaceti]|uniref:DUF2975 domain-containing protein n=2 Tax=Rathayibacter tanaceti TaxID=1671680 RepID=A0A166IG67_9MICO|nr:DUF2975 domain-containing protein [Rathayibacter tanaceti]KZX22335.1 hypothetical protein ACH61_00488 [Rathayibacter tanaceti]QHC54625.1 DUF2975 domain-containing protein [Rathayibacter tanaceti]TCO37576.1 DUF2975 family protein [Rathayibacter tanaceti]
MPRNVLRALRTLLIVLLLGCVLIQAGVGPMAAKVLEGGPMDAVLVAVAIAGVLCVEAVIVAVWRLLTLAYDDVLFSGDRRSDIWVDVAIGAFAFGAVFAVLGAVASAVVVSVPLLVVVLLLVAAASGALALLVVVMRRLLHLAVAQRSELSEVV